MGVLCSDSGSMDGAGYNWYNHVWEESYPCLTSKHTDETREKIILYLPFG